MHPGQATKVGAAACGLAGFAIGVIAGLSADNPADVILLRAIVAMVVCNVVGWLFGMVVERIMKDNVAAYASTHAKASAQKGEDNVIRV